MFVRLGNARQRIRHTEGDDAGSNAGSGSIRSGRLKIAAPLGVNLIDCGLRQKPCPSTNQEALVVTGGTVGAGRTVGIGRVGAVAVRAVEISSVVVHERIVLVADVVVDTLFFMSTIELVQLIIGI